MTDLIKKWCDNNNALSRTLEMFWNCFEIYSNEDYEEYITVFPDGEKMLLQNLIRFYMRLTCQIFHKNV